MARAKDIRTDMQMVSLGDLGGKVRHLKFDLNAFAELETKFGSIEIAMDALQGGSIHAIKIILWAGLLHDEVVLDEDTGEPIKFNITPYGVGSWITAGQLPEITDNLVKAINMGLPEQEEPSEVPKVEVKAVDPNVAKVVLTPEEVEEEKND